MKQSGVLSATNIYGHVSLGEDCLDEFLWSLIRHLGFKRVISRGCPHVPCLKVEPVYSPPLSHFKGTWWAVLSFHSPEMIVASKLSFPGLNVCFKLLLKLKWLHDIKKKSYLKEVHHKLSILSSFTHLRVVPDQYYFLVWSFFNAKGQKKHKSNSYNLHFLSSEAVRLVRVTNRPKYVIHKNSYPLL